MVKFKYVLNYIRKYIFKFISSFFVVLFLLLPFSVSAASVTVYSGSDLDFPDLESAFNIGSVPTIVAVGRNGNNFDYNIAAPTGSGPGITNLVIPFYFSSMPSKSDNFIFSFDVHIYSPETSSSLQYWAYQIYYVKDKTRFGIPSSSVSISGNSVHVDCSNAPLVEYFVLVVSFSTTESFWVYHADFSNIKASVTPLTPEYQDNYNDFSSESSAVEEYDRVEGELIDGSNSVWGQIKTEIFDNSLLNPNSMGPLRGLFAAGDIFSFFASEPHISPLLRYSLLIGLACFILGVALFTSTRFRKK